MKSIKIIALLLLTAFAADAQETVRGKTKLNTDFQDFKTFTWAQAPYTNELIKTSIQQELQSRGYTQSEASADLIVSYQILDRRIRVKGFIDDTPSVVGGEEVREPSDTTSYILEPGTLMISMIDRKTSEVVWDGFASGMSKSNAFATKPEKVKEIVARIFSEFKHRATPLEN
jgi:hypothetical protein